MPVAAALDAEHKTRSSDPQRLGDIDGGVLLFAHAKCRVEARVEISFCIIEDRFWVAHSGKHGNALCRSCILGVSPMGSLRSTCMWSLKGLRVKVCKEASSGIFVAFLGRCWLEPG